MNKKEEMLEKLLRKEIRTMIKEILVEKKSESLSGMKKMKDTNDHTNPKKGVKAPKAIKVAKDGPPASVTATSELKPDDNGVEIKKMKNSDKDTPKNDNNKFEAECYGVQLKVKGASLADVNHLLMVGQIKKALEGKGKYVKKIEIEMGDADKLEEVRNIVRQNIKKMINESPQSNIDMDEITVSKYIRSKYPNLEEGDWGTSGGSNSYEDTFVGGYYFCINTLDTDKVWDILSNMGVNDMKDVYELQITSQQDLSKMIHVINKFYTFIQKGKAIITVTPEDNTIGGTPKVIISQIDLTSAKR